jgi:hypothetical protein
MKIKDEPEQMGIVNLFKFSLFIVLFRTLNNLDPKKDPSQNKRVA